ncbi:hypothetical protein CXB51_031694 [Gossypium anomalum]|uniref:RNase H type-1 domain-containing protein n=1 Tax=Gossypium anomalum TaxID=47600 RepID=A0A8J6CJS0_9ROSI|nr:hypothetical protein CXB51_031694 [Gossypium anomalum]
MALDGRLVMVTVLLSKKTTGVLKGLMETGCVTLVGMGLHRLFWKTIWKLKILSKIQGFTWHLGHKLLPTKVNISSIRQTVSRDCTRCSESVETLVHTLKDYPTARAILTFGCLDRRLINKDYSYCIDWMEYDIRLLMKKAMDSQNSQQSILPLHTVLKKWEKLHNDTVKINFDVTLINNKTGFDVIVHDSDGFLIGGGYGFKDEKMLADWAKVYAFEESFKVARSLSIANAIFETDYVSFANMIKKRREDITIIGHRINDLFKTMDMFNNVVIKWVNRNCNKIADFMCKYAITKNCNLVFAMDYPMEIHDFVMFDYIN